jgi:ribosome maturation factor RimP
MSTEARLQQLIEPIVTGLGLELFDLQYKGSVLTVLVDRPGDGRVDLEAVTAATRAVSRALDEADPVAGRYSLEVSSPGLERPLRTPAHFAGALGETVTVKTVPGHDGPRRLRGELVAVTPAPGPDGDAPAGADEASIDVRADDTGRLHTVALAEIERARTVFEWGPAPKPKAKPRTSKPGKAATRAEAAGPPAPDATTDVDGKDDKKVSAT